MKRWIDIDGEKVPMAKGNLGWRVIHPAKNFDNTVNYPNLLFGGNGNLIRLIIYIIIAVSLFYGIKEMNQSCQEFAKHPCDYVCCPMCKTGFYLIDNNTLDWIQNVSDDINMNVDK